MRSRKSAPEKAEAPAWAKNPKQKIDWALKLLHEKGHSVGDWVQNADGRAPSADVDGKLLLPADVYKLVDKYPEWNDRLGLGTARLRRAR